MPQMLREAAGEVIGARKQDGTDRWFWSTEDVVLCVLRVCHSLKLFIFALISPLTHFFGKRYISSRQPECEGFERDVVRDGQSFAVTPPRN